MNLRELGLARTLALPDRQLPLSTRRPAEVPTAKDMAMQVRHRFARIRPVVEHQAEAGLSQSQLARHLRGF